MLKKALWLDVPSHMTSFNQFECFISAWLGCYKICLWHRLKVYKILYLDLKVTQYSYITTYLIGTAFVNQSQVGIWQPTALTMESLISPQRPGPNLQWTEDTNTSTMHCAARVSITFAYVFILKARSDIPCKMHR